MKRALYCAAVLLAAGCFSGYETPAQSPDLRVRRGAFHGDVILTGELRAGRGDDLVVPRLPQWQTSIKWLITDGAEVKQGERVVELDKAKLEAAMPKEVVSARDFQDRQIKFQRAEVELAKANDVLRAQQISVASDRDNLLIKLHTAERELRTAVDALDQLVLRAPRAGIAVVRDHPWEGRKLQEGDGVWVGFPLAQIPEASSLRVEADLADVDDGKIGAGMPATVVLDAYPGLTFPARIGSVAAVAQESSRQSLRRAFAVIVSL